ncbi:SAV_2336 N-terminal domain-related protein [Streptomyces sp. NPDC089799]|uniref:SAV_2336 N-terminal domain-related protein n=1 Tax=Streptomyces sp. NPDC089799 TaxID=3155066 RepID=UPI003431F44C
MTAPDRDPGPEPGSVPAADPVPTPDPDRAPEPGPGAFPGAGPGPGPGPAPGGAPAPGPELRALVGVLRSGGLDPTAEELADALWLAARTGGAAGTGPSPDATEDRPAPPPGTPEARDRHPDAAPAGPVRPSAPPEDDPLSLYAPGRPGAGGGPGGRAGQPPDGPAGLPPGTAAVPVRVPAAAALPRILDIQRALRALQRHRPPAPPARLVLDEPATADASARALGQVIPVLRPEARRETTVRLVMDASPSMAVWQDMFDELRAVCERLGAFRDVQTHYLHRLPDGTPAVGRGPSPDTGVRSAEQLRDPTGRGITMVVSDCTGPLWRDGRAQRLLHRWAECTPAVVVQPLPQRLWGRTWLPTERGTLAREEGAPGGLRFRSDRPAPPGRPAWGSPVPERGRERGGGLTVPVLPPNARALGAWARLVAGLGSGPVPAEVGRVLAAHPGAPAPPPRAARPPREVVRRFRSTASPRAVQLAVYLSATPLTLPVMRLVQRTMLPDSEPSDLAEVLLGGLLRRTSDQWYEFVPGVQEVLLGPLGRDEAALVLKHCSEYVIQHFGRGVRNFPALAVAQLTGVAEAEREDDGPEAAADPAGRVPPARLPQAFARVSAKVVRRYLPVPPPEAPARPEVTGPDREAAVRAARARLAAHDRDGGQRALHEAVALLRRAVAANRAEGRGGGSGEEAGQDARRHGTDRAADRRAGRVAEPAAERAAEEAEYELAGALLRMWAVQRDPELLAEAERLARRLAGLPVPETPGRETRGRETPGPATGTATAGMAATTGTGTAAATEPPVRDRARVLLGRVLCERAGVAAGPEAAELLTAADAEFEAVERLLPAGELRTDAAVRRAEVLVRLHGLREDPAYLHTAYAVLAFHAGADPDAARPGPALALGRVLLALADREPEAGPRTVWAGRAATWLAAGLAGLGGGPGRAADPATGPEDRPGDVPGGGPGSGHGVGPGGGAAGGPSGGPADGPPGGGREAGPGTGPGLRPERAAARVALAGALRHLPARLEEAAGQLATALDEAAGDPEARLAALVCLARVHRARSARDGDPAALEAAGEAYGRARRLIPRDAEAYGDLLPEWGDVLLERARAADGRRFVSAAVRVLRESRSAVPQSDPRVGRRLLRLATGLRLRHGYEGDPVDLREAEYLLELAVRNSPEPLDRARAWREHGDVQRELHAHTRAADRLDLAADSYRRAWRAALEADRADRGDTAARLAARVQELRGEVLELLGRPRAALDAYRAALELWQRIGADRADGDGRGDRADGSDGPNGTADSDSADGTHGTRGMGGMGGTDRADGTHRMAGTRSTGGTDETNEADETDGGDAARREAVRARIRALESR